MEILQKIQFNVAVIILLFSSCKKPTTPVPSENVSFELNQKTAYSKAEEILVTNKSIGTWTFEWYIDDKLVSENIILTKDKLQNVTNNVKHELKLVGVNSSGIIKIYLDTFEYRDTIHFNKVKFSNYSSDFIKRLTEDTQASFIGLDLRYSSQAIGRVTHYPPLKNCLISYVWKLDSFRAYENKYFDPRVRDFPASTNQTPDGKNYIKTDMFDIQNNLYCLFGSKMRNDLSSIYIYNGSLFSSIIDIKLDRKNKQVLIKTSQLDIALKL